MTALFEVECDCGYRKASKTAPLAEYGLRKHSCERHRAIRERRARGDAIRAEHEANRTPKPCTHKMKHTHGTHACYVLDRCRCLPCTRSNTTYERRRVRNNAYGRPPYIDAEPARRHVKALMAHGVGWKRVAKAANVPFGTMSKLIYGDAQRRLAPSKRVRPETAAKILAVTVDVADGQRIDATATRELVKAIVARGYPLAWITSRIGMDNQRLLYREKVTAGTARAIRLLADEVALTAGDNARAFATARRNGWTADALWADVGDPTEPVDTIDEVAVQRFIAGDDVKLDRDEKRAAYLALRGRGVSHNQSALRLGVNSMYAKEWRDRYETVPAGRTA